MPAAGVPSQAVPVVVQVEDISRADAPAPVVGEQRQSAASLRPGAVLPFAVEVPAERIDERNRYSVRVHVDVGGTGEVKKGDLVSTETYPVLTRAHGSQVDIKLRVV
jgi:uncharacterized lipoprotein YbaY